MNKTLTDIKGVSGVAALFASTLFLSASLMFTVQPMAGKMLLPLFGGAPGVWLSAMAYFQTALVAGYVLAHGLSLFPVRAHMAAFLLLLAGGFFLLPVHMEPLSAQQDFGALATVKTLLSGLSLPFLALSCLSPTLQRLFSTRGENPYFLFAASNLGSFAGLLVYPLVFEFLMGLSGQAQLWRWGYLVLFVLCVFCWAVVARGAGKRAKENVVQQKPETSAPVTFRQRTAWLFYAFVPSSLMMGLTSHVTTDLGGVPFFWMLPLGVYLWTFVLAFSEKDNKDVLEKHLSSLAILSVCFVVSPLFMKNEFLKAALGIVVGIWTFGLAARVFHGMLAESKPQASRLTEYYLWIAVGGALGGLFHAFLVPILFVWPVEFVFFVFVSVAFLLLIREKSGGEGGWKNANKKMSLIFTALSVAFFLLFPATEGGAREVALHLLFATSLVGLFFFSFFPFSVGAPLLITGFLGFYFLPSDHLETRRNFLGSLKVIERTYEEKGTVRRLVHGTTLHGLQKVAPVSQPTLNSYYGPVGDFLDGEKARSAGVVGLGVGTVLCASPEKTRFTVYEIDPDVVELSGKWFDYAKACGAPVVKMGDGRKSLENDCAAVHDAIIIDAFSSDFIPVHLLTREAMELYMARTSPTGLVAFHVSNRFYDLVPQLSAQIALLGLSGLTKHDTPPADPKSLNTQSVWVVVARRPEHLASLRDKGWTQIPASDKRVWTDDRSNLLAAVRLF